VPDNVVIGIDSSINNCGVAVVHVVNRNPIVVKHDIISPPKKLGYGGKLEIIYDAVTKLIDEHKPYTVVRERGFSRHANSTQTIVRAVGVTDLAVRKATGWEVAEYEPSVIKKALTGNGRADKQMVMNAITKRIPIYEPFKTEVKKGEVVFKYDDSDAIAAAVTHLIFEGLIEWI
jgi:crossover junction endodeoxyribonuclease RuvC